ncbi:MAG TPA: ATP-dependent sacrificial sulfur transferase LarE [Acidobacteriaceae bacterium]|nr:ATP-dependent sacrificial sulfur transferase LarE [Acidobacteriaceae bacterium]
MSGERIVHSTELEQKFSALRINIAALDSLLVAYSGGTDSAYLAHVAHEVLGARMLAVIADSPSLPRAELAAALAFARQHSIPVETLSTHELANPQYQRNDAQRCFHCKDELFTQMETLRAERGFAHIAYGRNLDDDGDFRPGQSAAALHRAVAPLADAGLRKAEIRTLARAAGLSLADKPASACLSSRIEYGRPVTAEALAQVEAAEAALHALGFTQLRVRHHGELARIELTRAELPRALSLELFDRISRDLRALDFRYITLDLEGFRSGSMNALLPVSELNAADSTTRHR